MPRVLFLLFCSAITVVAVRMPAGLQAQEGNALATPTVKATLRAKALPDECYKGLGVNGPPPVAVPPCANGIPKVNSGYVWSLAVSGNDIWFGTVSNPLCLVQAAVVGAALPAYENDSWACEFEQSPFSFAYNLPLPPMLGDARIPSIYVYDKTTATLQNITPKGPFGVPVTVNTIGLRAATIIGDMVLFAGPDLNPFAGLNLFAFNRVTKEFLGMTSIRAYSNIRSFAEHNGSVYAGVGAILGGGYILRWNGTITPYPCETCFDFQVVGILNGHAASIAAHAGRLYSTTWPGDPGKSDIAGLWMSPPIPATGLRPIHALSWSQVWKVDAYEPDPVIAKSYGGGALTSFDGYLYWGTMHEPGLAALVWTQTYGTPADPAARLQLALGTLRSALLFRGKDLDTATPTIELVYGNRELPVYSPPTAAAPDTWTLKPNNMPAGHNSSLFGPSGFGYLFNGYIWSMNVWNNRLWLGTLDWSYLAVKSAAVIGLQFPSWVFNSKFYGADLYSIASSSTAANTEFINGIGNKNNAGIRAMGSSGNLFLGTANNMNLATNPSAPMGGWEVLEVSPLFPSSSLTAFANPWIGAVTHPLLAPYNLEGPAPPSGFQTPDQILARTLTGARDTSIRVGVPAGYSNAQLFELRWDGTKRVWANITTASSNTQVQGSATTRSLGVYAVMRKQ